MKKKNILDIRKEDGADYTSMKKSVNQKYASEFRLSVFQAFNLLEPDIYQSKDEKTLSMSPFRGTKIFDVLTRASGLQVSTHTNLDLMDTRKIRVLAHKRPHEGDEVVYSVTENDFWMILDAMALMAAEIRHYKGEDIQAIDRDELYQEDVAGAIYDLLKHRNQEVTSLDKYIFTKINEPIKVKRRKKDDNMMATIAPYYLLTDDDRYRHDAPVINRRFMWKRCPRYEHDTLPMSNVWRAADSTLSKEERIIRGLGEHGRMNPSIRYLYNIKGYKKAGFRLPPECQDRIDRNQQAYIDRETKKGNM